MAEQVKKKRTKKPPPVVLSNLCDGIIAHALHRPLTEKAVKSAILAGNVWAWSELHGRKGPAIKDPSVTVVVPLDGYLTVAPYSYHWDGKVFTRIDLPVWKKPKHRILKPGLWVPSCKLDIVEVTKRMGKGCCVCGVVPVGRRLEVARGTGMSKHTEIYCAGHGAVFAHIVLAATQRAVSRLLGEDEVVRNKNDEYDYYR